MAQSGTPITFEAECEKCGLQFTVPIDRFKDKSYVNWIVSGLGLQYTKEGLEGIIETTSQEFYNNIKQDIQAAAACGQCDLSEAGNKNPNCVSNCPRSACGPFKHTLESHTTSRIDWKCVPYKNITSPATLSAIYLPYFMAQSYTSPAKADMSAFLNLLEWCVPFKNKIYDMQLVNKVRESRNALMHSGTMRMDTAELNVHLSNYIALLEDKQQLQADNKCKEAIENIKMIRDADVEMKQLTEIEKEVFDKVDQTHNLEIDEIRQKLESNDCSTDEAKTLKDAAKKLEEKHVKLRVLHEVYKLPTTDIDKRKNKCTTLYEDVERSIKRTISQAHETQLKDLKQHLDEEKNKSAKIQQSYEENQNTIDTLHKKLNKKQTLDETLEKHLAPLQKDMRDLKQRISTVEHQTKGFARSHQVSKDGVNATGTTETIPQQQSTSGKEMLIGVQDDSFVQELPVEIKVKENKKIKLECKLTKPDKHVTWFKDDTEITADDHLNITMQSGIHQIVISQATLDDAGRYSCVCGAVRTDCTVSVEELPAEIQTKLCDVEVNENEIIKLQCQLTKPDKHVTWLKDDTEITADDHLNITMDADTHQIVISQATLDDAGKYSCVCGDVWTECLVTVEELPAEIQTKLCDVEVNENEIIKLQCQLTKPDKHVTWFKDDTEITADDHLNITMDADTHQIVISQATLDDAGKYSCACGDVKTVCTVTIQDLEENCCQTDDVTVTEIGTINVRTADDRVTCRISGSALLPGDKLVLADYKNNKIKLINMQTSEITSQLDVSDPWDVASITDNQVAVTLRDAAKKIVFVTVTSVLKLDREMSVDGKCTGIVYNNSRLILAFRDPVKIEIMTMDGTVEKNIECSKVFKSPSHIALSPTHDAIYVSDYNGACVTRLGLDGEVEAEYRDKQLRYPTCVIVDQQGRMIVCGGTSHNIHLLTAELAKIKLLVDGLDSPQSLSLCRSTGRLYVGRWTDEMSVYQLSQ